MMVNKSMNEKTKHNLETIEMFLLETTSWFAEDMHFGTDWFLAADSALKAVREVMQEVNTDNQREGE